MYVLPNKHILPTNIAVPKTIFKNAARGNCPSGLTLKYGLALPKYCFLNTALPVTQLGGK